MELFLRNDVYDAPGYAVSVTELYSVFMMSYPEAIETKRQFISKIPTTRFIKARVRSEHKLGDAGTWFFGNVSLKAGTEIRESYKKRGDYFA